MVSRKTKLNTALTCVLISTSVLSFAPITKANAEMKQGQVQNQSIQVKMKHAQVPGQPIQAFLVDKARYNPGEKVKMSLLFDTSFDWNGKLHLEVYHLNQKIAEGEKQVDVKKGLKGLEINWTPPSSDFNGYLVKASIEGTKQTVTAAVDVSSDWTHFPRYGYTTEFPKETAAQSDQKMKQLTQEYYLNGFQFYDWMWRHDVPVLSKTDSNGKPILDKNGNFITPDITANTSYTDLLGRTLYPLTIKQQVQSAQKYNAAAMAYQMNYAARENYEDFGVKKEWGLYNKNTIFPNPIPSINQNGFFFDWVKPAPTALYLQDPGNPAWQQFISKQFVRSVNTFGFDGIHLDQWGGSDTDYLYDYNGNKRYYTKDYPSLINAVKDSLVKNNPKKSDVTFNMVGGNDNYQAVPSPNTKTNFDYSEIWQDKDNYRDLMKVVNDTRAKNGGKAVVIAGYMNYKQATGDRYEVSDVKGVPKVTAFQSRITKSSSWIGNFGRKDTDYVTYTVNVPTAGSYKLTLHYGQGNSGGSPDGRLSVNDTVVAQDIPFDQNTDWGNIVGTKIVTASLKQGENKIKLQLNTDNEWLNVGALDVSGNGFNKRYDSIFADYGTSKVDQYGHLYNFETDGDYVQFHVNVPSEGDYPINFSYSIEKDPVSRELYVNGKKQNQLSFSATDGPSDFEEGSNKTVHLQAGDNTIKLKDEGSNDTGMNLQYLRVGKDRYLAEYAEVGWEPTQAAIIQKVPSTGSEVGNMDNFKQKGDFIQLKSEAIGKSETYPMTVYYKNTGSDTQRAIYVNGKKAGFIPLPTTGDKWSTATLPVYIDSRDSANTFMIKMEDETTSIPIQIDKIQVNDSMLEAEKGETGWQPVVPKTGSVTVEPGFTNNFGKAGQQVKFSVDSPAEINSLQFNYRTANNPVVNIIVDGTTVAKNVVFGSTPNGWGGAMVGKSINTKLAAGKHDITFEMASDGQYINLDSLIVGDQDYQVEDATFAPENNGISTTVGDVTDFKDDGDFLTFNVNASQAGKYDLTWRFNNDSGSQRPATRTVYVNGKKIDDITFSYTNAWEDKTMKDVPLNKGKNNVTIKVENVDDDGVKFDYLQVGNTKYQAELADTLAPMHIYKDTLLNFGHVGDEVPFDVNLSQKGETSFIFTYSNGGEDTARTIYVDGKPILDNNGNPYVVSFLSTGKFDSYGEDAYIVLPGLTAGKHTITLKQEEGQKGNIQLQRMTVGLLDEPSIRLMDAGLAAMGATHIELGTAENFDEGPNMLASEYYPNRSKKMTSSLKQTTKDYYKFFAAYENILFDSKQTDQAIQVENNGNPLKVSKDGSTNALWSITRSFQNKGGLEGYDVIHLINLLNNDQDWRNAANKPTTLTGLTVRYPIGKSSKELPNLKVYAASPDHDNGELKELQFKWDNTNLVITLPSLEYWDMIMIDRQGLEENKVSRIKW